MGCRADNQFFRHEYSSGCTAARTSHSEVLGRSTARTRSGHTDHAIFVSALRSKREGVAVMRPSTFSDLLLSRLFRCPYTPGVTADVAILTLKSFLFFLLAAPASLAATFPRPFP